MLTPRAPLSGFVGATITSKHNFAMQKSIRKEMFLGMIFLAAIIFLIFVTITISKLSIFSQIQYVKVNFENVSGLKEGDPVRVLGMEAGTVYRAKIMPNNTVRVVLKLSK